MNTQPDNPPAFPVASASFTADGSLYSARSTPGMTIREWYAGQIIAGLCANPSVFASNGMTGWGLVNCNEKELAGYAVCLADAMLRAREGKQ